MRSIIAKDRLEQQAKNSTLEMRKVDLKDFPNSKKKLVVQNIPLDIPESEIAEFFFMILVQSNKD